MAAVVNYSPPWWVNLLHRLPHFNLQFEQTSSDFRPEDSSYQQVSPCITVTLLLFDTATCVDEMLFCNMKWLVLKTILGNITHSAVILHIGTAVGW